MRANEALGLPDDWGITTLDEVARSVGGGTPSKSDPTFWTDGVIPWVSPKDMKTFAVTSSEDLLAKKALDRLSLVPVDSVLIVVRSGILSRTLPVALNKLPVTINQDMRAFMPATGVSGQFLALQLMAKEHEVLTSCSKDGTTVASLEGPALARFPLWLAPAAEQTRIVEKLEELLSDLDAGVSELKAAQKKLGQYRQSLLKAAVEGALTAQWRAQHTPTETGAQLLERILKERRARWEAKQLAKFAEQGKAAPKDWRTKYPEPVRPDISGLPKIPHGWAWASFDEITSFVTSGSRGWADYYSDSGAVFIRSQDINRDFLNLSDTAFVNPPLSSEGARTLVRQNDVLLTITGANVGKSAIVSTSLPEAYVSQHVALIRLIDTDLSNFAHLFLTADAGGRGKLLKTAYGAGKPGLNLQQIAALPIPIAGKDELTEMGNILSSQFNAMGQQQAAIDVALKQSAAQRKNILKAAFSGQLVPQDPGDEPAAVLLERIRAERAAHVKAPKARRVAQERA